MDFLAGLLIGFLAALLAVIIVSLLIVGARRDS